jgi:hypothetical protein
MNYRELEFYCQTFGRETGKEFAGKGFGFFERDARKAKTGIGFKILPPCATIKGKRKSKGKRGDNRCGYL